MSYINVVGVNKITKKQCYGFRVPPISGQQTKVKLPYCRDRPLLAANTEIVGTPYEKLMIMKQKLQKPYEKLMKITVVCDLL